MNRSILLFLVISFVLCYYSSSSQESYIIKCKMTSEEIMSVQSFNIDLPEYKKAKTISESLLSNMELLSIAINDNDKNEARKLKEMILSAINSAEIIKMDYSMFKEDLDFIKKLDLNN